MLNTSPASRVVSIPSLSLIAGFHGREIFIFYFIICSDDVYLPFYTKEVEYEMKPATWLTKRGSMFLEHGFTW